MQSPASAACPLAGCSTNAATPRPSPQVRAKPKRTHFLERGDVTLAAPKGHLRRPSLRTTHALSHTHFAGWLQTVDKGGRKRHRYFCLTPTYLAYFHDEASADVSDAGFMYGDADYKTLPTFGNAGACVQLANIYASEPHDHLPQFQLVMREGLDDGTQAMDLFCSNMDIAHGWSDAINNQKERYKDVRAPPRTLRDSGGGKPTALLALEAAEQGLSNAINSDAAVAAGKHVRGALFGLFGMKSGDEPERADSAYVVHSPWEAKGIDLTSRDAKSCLEDEHGHPATVIHGWLTKRNKSGVYAGSVEKERYFVLTPTALCFFPDDLSADIRNGYLWGKAEGEKIGGMFKAVGARLPLESVCEVRLVAKDGKSVAIKSPRRRGGTDSDEEEEEDVRKKPTGPKPKLGKAGSKGTLRELPAPSRAALPPSTKPAGPAPTNNLEVDFGEFSLSINAHNTKCRTEWATALRKWSGMRKRQRDEELFGGGGM